jgi:dehydrogenase
MKAAVIPQVNATWELRDVPAPQPGPADVLIKIHACGVCSNDVLATNGTIPFPAITPAITGHEPVGEIVQTGPLVTTRKIGDLVGTTWIRGTCGRCEYCKLGLPLSGQAAFLCAAPVSTGFTVPGGHAEYMTAPADQTILIPPGLAPELAAPILCAGYTSWSALRTARPQPHERIAVLGIGGLGHLAIQYAKACGHETIAITRTPDKHPHITKLGADLILSTGQELKTAGGADIILVTGNSHQAAADALQGLRPHGRMVIAGIDPAQPLTLGPALTYPLFALRHTITGSTHNGPQYLHEALNLAAAGKVTPMIETFDKEHVADAVTKTAQGQVRFRAVVRY